MFLNGERIEELCQFPTDFPLFRRFCNALVEADDGVAIEPNIHAALKLLTLHDVRQLKKEITVAYQLCTDKSIIDHDDRDGREAIIQVLNYLFSTTDNWELYRHVRKARKKPQNLESLMKLCDADHYQGYVRCISIYRLFELLDDGDDTESVTLPDGTPLMLQVIDTLSKVVHDEAIARRGDDGSHEDLHDKDACLNCWVMAMTALIGALERSYNSNSKKLRARLIDEVLNKYKWNILFPPENPTPEQQEDFQQWYTMHANVWTELHRHAHFRLLETRNRHGDATGKNATGARSLLHTLGTECSSLFTNMLRIILNGINYEKDPRELHGELAGSSKFILWYYCCLVRRTEDPKVTKLRRQARAHLLSVLVDYRNTPAWKATRGEMVNTCYGLACMLKDRTYASFYLQPPEVQWGIFQGVLFGPYEQGSYQKAISSRAIYDEVVGFAEQPCCQCWKVEEDLEEGESMMRCPKCHRRMLCSSPTCRNKHWIDCERSY